MAEEFANAGYEINHPTLGQVNVVIDISGVLSVRSGPVIFEGKNYPFVGKGPWRKATEEDLARDELGFTNPNLHRRWEKHMPPKSTGGEQASPTREVVPRSYVLSIADTNSFRTTYRHTHVDYTELQALKDDTPEFADEIQRRFDASELEEIP